ncbi:MAG: hypothetical protein GTO22_08900 [Gemmatimonadales bacterium]|nr:hypothetical protein [Gemmatimonadales bacterium]
MSRQGIAGELCAGCASARVVRNKSRRPDYDGEDVFVLDLESREIRTGVAGLGNEGSARFSPDGQRLAYTSDESERPEVYVVAAFGGQGDGRSPAKAASRPSGVLAGMSCSSSGSTTSSGSRTSICLESRSLECPSLSSLSPEPAPATPSTSRLTAGSSCGPRRQAATLRVSS